MSRNSCRFDLRWTAAAFVCGATFAMAGAANAQLPGPSITRFPRANTPITVYQPSDAMFDTMVDTYFAGVDTSANYGKLRKRMLVLENRTSVGVRAYAVRWTIRRPDGHAEHRDSYYISTRLTYGSAGNFIPPGGVRLVSIQFSLPSKMFQKDTYRQQHFAERHRILNYGSGASVSGELDGVVYANGTFWGPDKTMILQRYLCARNAEHDEAISIQQQIGALRPLLPAEVHALLDQDVQRGENDGGRHLPAVYVRARGDTARQFEAILYRGGLARLEGALNTLATNGRPHNAYTFMNAWDSPGYRFKKPGAEVK